MDNCYGIGCECLECIFAFYSWIAVIQTENHLHGSSQKCVMAHFNLHGIAETDGFSY